MRAGLLLSAVSALALLSSCGPTEDNTTSGADSSSPSSPPPAPPTGDNAIDVAPPSAPANATSPSAPTSPSNGTASTPSTPAPSTPAPSTPGFSFTPAGQLVAGSGGVGITDSFQWAPALVFPIGDLPAYANSQVWGHGGSSGPGGGQCDSANYSYPWHDNFCETRAHDNHRCASAKGHQGQDIRPATCKIKIHPVVAAEAGVITNVGSFSVTLTGDSGRIYRYLHIDMAEAKAKLHVGQHLNPGDPMGHVSHDFGSTPTTIHLHFEIIVPTADYAGPGYNFVPGYTSLVAAYQRALTNAGVAG